ncbi:MAG: DMT family transporter [Gammaproteobacteria bacterium]|nr:DMT family transporter [Gammaproteobacteria bacterium]
MSVPISFVTVILIWSTTPLAIKWSSEGAGFIFGVTSRMAIGTLGCLLVLAVVRGKLPWHRQALQTYMAGGLGIFGAMSCVYWGSQFIPSGLISVIFGLTPLMTGLMAAFFLGEQSLTPVKLIGMASAFAGLVVIFGDGFGTGGDALLGMLSVLMAVFLHSASTVWVKKIGADVPVISMTTGGMLLALPLYLISWYVIDGQLPTAVPDRAIYSIVYLGIFGSVFGFILFFYVLKHVEASRVGLVPLVTPVSALLLGVFMNKETIPVVVWTGTGLILFGMAFYQWGGLLVQRFQLAGQEE